MTPEQRDEAVKLLAAYDEALASQPKTVSNATLIVMANYGDLCADLLRRIVNRYGYDERVRLTSGQFNK